MTHFRFADLFAGVGGFHAALSALGGQCVYAVEKDPVAARVYEQNWGFNPLGDLTMDATDLAVIVPQHDVLTGGFPCQPFSKSGHQRGMEEARGTLFWNIMRVIEHVRPPVVLLENVRNLVGPRHRHEWAVIVQSLRDQNYRVSDQPAIFSPHLLPPSRGGRPQIRERVFIAATHVPGGHGWDLVAEPPVNNLPLHGWDPSRWELRDFLEGEGCPSGTALSDEEVLWLDAWNDFAQIVREQLVRIPSFPIWVDSWQFEPKQIRASGDPAWKAEFHLKNIDLYRKLERRLDQWNDRWTVAQFPPSRRKFEWQAQDLKSVWDGLIHLRPSGIRIKKMTYAPALVAMNQASIVGPRRRRITVREAARLQGLPEWFEFADQSDSHSYRQLGNGVNVGVVWHVLRQHVERDRDILEFTAPGLLGATMSAPDSPDGEPLDKVGRRRPK